MDFYGLSRKDLQTLCKKNKIPANMTNIAMADALTALANVEGIEEIGGSEKAQPVPDSPYTCGRASTRRRAGKDQVVLIQNEQESSRLVSRTRGRPRKMIEDDEQDGKDPKDLSQDSSIFVPVPESPHTGLRSTRRRPISRNTDVLIENNFESLKPLTRTRCRTRKGNEDEEEQVDKDLGDSMENPSGAANPKTPAARNGRRRTGASAVKVNETNKKEDEEKEEEKDEKTMHIVTRVYSTRRSARLQPKPSEANLNTERRTKAVHITSLSEEENEESAPVKDELEKVSGDNNTKIFALNSCDSGVCALQEDLAPKDASAVVIPVEDSYDASIVPEQSTCEEKPKVENLIAVLLEQDSATEISGITDLVPDQMMMQENPHCLETEKPNLPASIVNGADMVSKQLTVEKTLQDNESEADDSNASEDNLIEEDASDVSKQLTMEKTYSLQDNESEADDSNASKDYLIEEDASDPVISAHLLHNNVEPAAERSENVKFECIRVEEPESQIAGKTEPCKEEEASCEFPSSCTGETLCDEIPEESSSEDLDNEMVVSEERSSCFTNDPDEEVKSTGDFECGDNEELGLHADGSGEIAPSLSEVWDFGLLKDSIQECLNGLESEKCNSDSVPLDIEVLGKVESGHEAPSHLDFNCTEITGWLNCESPEEAEPLDDKMVAPENPDVAMELSALADDKMKNQEFKQILDVISDANSVPVAKILCSGESNEEEFNKGVSDEITVSSVAVPSLLSPCRGLISESGYLLNQVKLTPSKSSTKKKTATPSQGKALIMVLDENKDNRGNHSGGLSLRKKSNSKTLASATDEKENMNISNYSGGLSLRNKSNSKVTLSIAEEKENDNKFEDSIQRTLKNTSLRQLKKMFKEKLLITDTDKEHQQEEKSRAALQTLTHNNSLMGNREN